MYLPSKYVFVLKACYKDGSIHPIYKDGRHTDESVWFPGGPFEVFITCHFQYQTLNDLGEPKNVISAVEFVMDITWEQKRCYSCRNGGLHLKQRLHFSSKYCDKRYRKQKGSLELTPNEIEQLAKQTLLRTYEFEMWVRRLSAVRKHRQEVARKASAKRKRKQV